MKTPLTKWGMGFAAVYLIGWMMVVPRVDAWMNARERRVQLEEELPQLRRLAARVPASTGGKRERAKDAAGEVEAALRESGLMFERIDPHLKSLERGRAQYTVAFTGLTEHLVRFLEKGQRANPRLVVTGMNVRSKEPGVGGELQLAVLLPSQVKSAPYVSARGRDPFHPPPPPDVKQPYVAPSVNLPPPPPPEPTVMMKLLGINEVKDLKSPKDPSRFEGLVMNEMTNTLQRVSPSTFADAGVTLEFDVRKGMIRVMRSGTLAREWRTGESISLKLLKPPRVSGSNQRPEGGSPEGGEAPPPPPPLP